jgi:RimJ/RimL family protein N-acetyltransferase
MLPPTFKTERYLITAYREEDEPRYLQIALDEEVIQFMGGATGNIEDEKKMFRKIFEIYKNDIGKWFWIWGIYSEGMLCAHLELKETEHTAAGELEVVYMVHPKERRKGLMWEVLEFLKENQHAWKKTIIATASPKNTSSVKLLAKWGIDKRELLIAEDTGERYYKLFLSK